MKKSMLLVTCITTIICNNGYAADGATSPRTKFWGYAANGVISSRTRFWLEANKHPTLRAAEAHYRTAVDREKKAYDITKSALALVKQDPANTTNRNKLEEARANFLPLFNASAVAYEAQRTVCFSLHIFP